MGDEENDGNVLLYWLLRFENISSAIPSTGFEHLCGVVFCACGPGEDSGKDLNGLYEESDISK